MSSAFIALVPAVLSLSPDEGQDFVNYLSSRLRTISQKTFSSTYREADRVIFEQIVEKSQTEVVRYPARVPFFLYIHTRLVPGLACHWYYRIGRYLSSSYPALPFQMHE